MQHAQFINISLEELSALMIEASEKGATAALQKITGADSGKQLSTKEAMALTGYASPEYFRKWIKANGITAVATRRRVKYYLLSDLSGANIKKNKSRFH